MTNDAKAQSVEEVAAMVLPNHYTCEDCFCACPESGESCRGEVGDGCECDLEWRRARAAKIIASSTRAAVIAELERTATMLCARCGRGEPVVDCTERGYPVPQWLHKSHTPHTVCSASPVHRRIAQLRTEQNPNQTQEQMGEGDDATQGS